MQHEETITIRVINWPRFCQTTEFSLDREIFRSDDAIRTYLFNRFGEGELHRVDERTWEFTRSIPGPQWWWKLLAIILNKSYV
jgi:hypothetical protein